MRFARATIGIPLLFVACLGCGCSNTGGSNSTRATDGDGYPAVGVEPPEVAAADWLNTDDPQTLAALRGNVVLVEFWATWCPPCVAGIPHLNELQEKYQGKGLRILSFTDEDRRKVEKFLKTAKSPIEYTVGLGSSLSQKYGVTGIPHAFLIGRDGKLLWQGHPSDCEDQIAAALAKK